MSDELVFLPEELAFKFGEKLFPLIKRGRAQAEQIHQLGKWLYEHGGGLIDAISTRGLEDNDLSGGLRIVSSALSKVTPDAMLGLYMILLGCELEFAEENFDLADLIDAVLTTYKEHPTIKKIVDRFFSGNSSDAGETDDSTISSTPTDGANETSSS